MITAWCIEFTDTGVVSERMWETRGEACAWASRELGPGAWQAIELSAFKLPAPAAHGFHGKPSFHSALSEIELITLDIISALKPFARAEEMERWGCGGYKDLAKGGRLQRMGFYSVNRAGAIAPNRELIKLALRQHPRPTRARDASGFQYWGQGGNPFAPSEPSK